VNDAGIGSHRDRHLAAEQLLDRMCVSMAGRASEIVFFGQASTSAQDDLAKITEMAYAQVAQFGMDKKVGNVSFARPERNEPILSKPYSEDTARLIDDEVRLLIDRVYKRTLALLRQKREAVQKVADALLEKEVLHREDLLGLLGPRPFPADLFYEKLLESEE
jgi:AFG3 family protein